MIGHLVGTLEPERFACRSASYTQFFDDSLILSVSQELKISYSIPACTKHVRLGVTGIFESTYLLYAAAAGLTPATTRQGGIKFGRELLPHLLVCIAPTGEERDELLWLLAPVHIEGEKTALVAAEVTRQALQLSLVIFPGGAVAF